MQKRKKSLLYICCIFIISMVYCPLYAQTTVQNNFDAETFKSKGVSELNDKIASQIEDWLKQGESAVLDKVHWKDMLKEYEAYGIDPNGDEYYNKAIDLYTSIKNDPNYDPQAAALGSMKGMLQARVETEISQFYESVIDEESRQIAEELQGLYTEANNKITKILEGLNKIGEWDEDEEEFQSKLEEEIRSWGIKGPLAGYIRDFDEIYTKVNDSYGSQMEMAGSLVNLLNEDDPTNRIEAMFAFGADYGGEIPVLGDIVSNLFKVGQELLKAAKRAGGILEQNYGQGCLNNQGEYNALTSKKKKFRDKFPKVVSACPLSYSISHGPYYHIYEENGNLFFYYNKSWHSAPNTGTNKGREDIQGIIQWLRKIGNDKYNDLATIYEIYTKEPGFLSFRKQINDLVKDVQNGVRKNLTNVGYCEEKDLEKYLFNTIDLNWIRKLIGNDQLDISRARVFDDGLAGQIEEKMLENRYFKRGKANLNNLSNIVSNLRDNVPVQFTGRVISRLNSKPIAGAKVTPPFATQVILEGESCQKLTTDENGEYIFYMRMPVIGNKKVAIQANYEGIRSAPEFEINVNQSTFYEFNIFLDVEIEEELSDKEKCAEKEGYTWDEENEVCLPAITCEEIANTVRVINENKTAYICDCLSPNKWNEDRTLCLSIDQQKEEESGEKNCTGEYMTYNADKDTCDCISGYIMSISGNCEKEEKDVAILEIEPSSKTIGIEDEVIFQVFYTDSSGKRLDVTLETAPSPFFPGKEGVHEKTVNYLGLSATAVITVGGCADPNAVEVNGECQCKDGYVKDYQGNCLEASAVFSVIKIEPESQSIGVGQDPVISVFGVNALGETFDITNLCTISGLVGVGDISGVFTISANYQGQQSEAKVLVNECADSNSELNMVTGECDCKQGFFRPQGGMCISEDEILEELEEEVMEDCENLPALAAEYSSLISQMNRFNADFKSSSDRFFKEVNDRAADLCQNQMAAFTYAQSLTWHERLTDVIQISRDTYFELDFMYGCPNYASEIGQYNLGAYDLGSLLDQASYQEGLLQEMNSRIKENGCNEEDLGDIGRTIVDKDKDPELISMGGTGIELAGDGKDNDGDGQEDELPVTAELGYNVTIVIYDSGSAKDDVFSLNVSGVGDLGTTPEGGLRTYPLQLPSGNYTASITVLVDGGGGGTYTINIFVDGISVNSAQGSPSVGTTNSFDFMVN